MYLHFGIGIVRAVHVKLKGYTSRGNIFHVPRIDFIRQLDRRGHVVDQGFELAARIAQSIFQGEIIKISI